MLVPSKFTTLEESTVFKMLVILTGKQAGETVAEALSRTKSDFQDASEFLSALDVLFFLGYLDVQESSGVIEYA
ncbi:ABC-three component system middle component 7 [Billgrantia desiderata]|uniref:ABC-three component system middle component 7 n=1 Tax=Billgrantia desiderata TaxID=52021 RepID=UPI000CDEAF85